MSRLYSKTPALQPKDPALRSQADRSLLAALGRPAPRMESARGSVTLGGRMTHDSISTCPACGADLTEVPASDPCPQCGGNRRSATLRAVPAAAVADASSPTAHIIEEWIERDGRWLALLFLVSLASGLISGLVVHGWWAVGVSLLGACLATVVGLFALMRTRRERSVR